MLNIATENPFHTELGRKFNFQRSTEIENDLAWNTKLIMLNDSMSLLGVGEDQFYNFFMSLKIRSGGELAT